MIKKLFNKASLRRNKEARKKMKATKLLRTAKAKKLFTLCRWLHIYTSCALFSLLLFFCITGITLNHQEWTDSSAEKISSFNLPKQLAEEKDGEYPVKKIQAYVEQVTGLASPRSVDIAIEISEITYDYPLPAGYAFITVLLDEKRVEIEHGQSGLLALLNDLHKGRHSGVQWSWLIDISAILMAFFTLTGVIILFQNSKHRRSASVILLLGTFTPILIYLLAVPRL